MKIHLIHWTELPNEAFSRKLMEDELFREYVKDNGWHFTDALANHASRHLVNVDGSQHRWTSKDVEDAFSANGLSKPERCTWGDITFAANMHYSDEYPRYLKTEKEVIDYTARYANDPDGYEGMQFMRWLSDLIGRKETVDWDVFVH